MNEPARRPAPTELEGPSGGSCRLTVEHDPDLEDLALLEDQVTAALVDLAGVGPEREFALFVRDDGGRVVAGLSGTTWGTCCQLHAMWIDEPVRARGWARTLVAGAEDEARRRGCDVVVFLACDLVVPGFYERIGYRTAGVVDGCPPGSALRLFHKDLAP